MATTIQYRTWKHGRPGDVKEQTFPTQAAFDSAIQRNEKRGADIEILRYCDDITPVQTVINARREGNELAASLAGRK